MAKDNRCKNCNSEIKEYYCSHCGQEVKDMNLSILSFFKELPKGSSGKIQRLKNKGADYNFAIY